MGGNGEVERYTLVHVLSLAAHWHLGCTLGQMDRCFSPRSVKTSVSRDI